MYFRILLNIIFGYVNIEVEGYFIERFINICVSKKIFLWNVKRKNAGLLTANIGIYDFKKIKNVAKKTKCKIHINQKKGIPFLLNRYKKRKIFIGMLAMLIVSILILSNFIWNIEIIGNETISNEEIQKQLEDKGISIGKLKNKINTKEIINQIRLERDDIAWMGISLEGTNAKIEIVEAEKKPDIINPEEYCNIISDKEGVIVKITAKNGTQVAKVGDVVKKGSVLIGGWIEGKFTGTRYMHSEGEVLAKVWYSKKEKMSYVQDVTSATRIRRKKIQYPYK